MDLENPPFVAHSPMGSPWVFHMFVLSFTPGLVYEIFVGFVILLLTGHRRKPGAFERTGASLGSRAKLRRFFPADFCLIHE